MEDCEDKQGSVYYLTWRKARLILGRELGRGEYMRAKPLLQRLGFRRAKTSDGTAFIINTRSPLMLMLRYTENLGTAVSRVRRYLGR